MATALIDPTIELRPNVRLMTLGEIEEELERLDARRRLLMRARRFIVELGEMPAENGRPASGRH